MARVSAAYVQRFSKEDIVAEPEYITYTDQAPGERKVLPCMFDLILWV